MKSVLISIQPKWCEKICKIIGKDFFGKPKYMKRLELRKSKPNIETPFKVYIYETKGKRIRLSSIFYGHEGKGKIIGEFVCDYILRHCEMSNADIAEEQGCVLREDILKYSNGKEVFGWHISELVIYDTPKELNEFKSAATYGRELRRKFFGKDPCCVNDYRLTRPPQSWCYVEELGA